MRHYFEGLCVILGGWWGGGCGGWGIILGGWWCMGYCFGWVGVGGGMDVSGSGCTV